MTRIAVESRADELSDAIKSDRASNSTRLFYILAGCASEVYIIMFICDVMRCNVSDVVNISFMAFYL